MKYEQRPYLNILKNIFETCVYAHNKIFNELEDKFTLELIKLWIFVLQFISPETFKNDFPTVIKLFIYE